MHHDFCRASRRENRRIIEYRPPRIAMALLLAATALHAVLPAGSLYLFSSPGPSIALGAVGFAVMMLAWRQFQVRQVAICPTEATAQLITDGIYRVTRNPMYLGMIAMLVAVALYVGTLPYFVVVLVYFVLIDRWFCRYEEEKLLATFGRSYENYQSTVRRWL